MILIFGGTSGIGASLASLLVGAGQPVTIFGRDADRAERVGQQLGCAWGVCPAQNFQQVERVFAETDSVTAAVNCAGSILLKPAHLTSEQDFDSTLEQNLKTAFSVTRAAGKHMRSGSVLLFSSAAASFGLPNHEAIAAAKAGVEGLVRSAAATYASRGLRFNAIAPGLVDTPLAVRITSRPAAREASQAQHPLGRIGTAEEIASLAFWLLGPEAQWVTGQIFGMDGGLSRVQASR